jgi:hypothetical protein
VKLKKTASETLVCCVRCMEKTAELLRSFSQNDFMGYYQAWRSRREHCVASVGNWFVADNM